MLVRALFHFCETGRLFRPAVIYAQLVRPGDLFVDLLMVFSGDTFCLEGTNYLPVGRVRSWQGFACSAGWSASRV